MADGVQIPVIIDIDQAFKDAAARVSTASKPLKASIEALNEELAKAMTDMNKYAVDSTRWKGAVKQIQRITELLDLANDKVNIYGANTGSIKQMEAELARLSRQWEKLGAEQKFTASGELSADAQKLVTDYKAVTAEIQKSGKSLAQMVSEEERLASAERKRLQTEREENRIISQNAKSMRDLQAQERILTQRLQTAPIGSEKFQILSSRLAEVRKQMSLVSAEVSKSGAAYGTMSVNATKATAAVSGANVALNSQRGILAKLQGYLSGYMLAFSGFRFMQNVRDTTAELELQRVSLGSLLRDAELANDLFRQIKAAALKSPFEIKDLVTYTKQLAAYRIENEKLFDTTMKLADISAGLGVDMGRLILAFGQVRAASVLRGQELRQFTEAGIPLVDELAAKFTELRGEMVSTGDVFELISKRAVPFKMIEQIFDDMTSAGGRFYKMQEKQSETLKGQWMKLKDAVTIMYDEIGNTPEVHDAMTGLVQAALSLTRSWREAARILRVLLGTMITYSTVVKASAAATKAMTYEEALLSAVDNARIVKAPKVIAAIIGDANAKKIDQWATLKLVEANTKLNASNTLLGRSFAKLIITILKNPYAAAAAGIVALGFGIRALIKNNKQAELSVDSLQQAMSNLSNQATKTADTMMLVDAYEKLNSKIDKTAAEQEKLGRVSRELAKVYPETVEGINSETDALQINIDKVKELTLEEQRLAEVRLRALAKEAKDQLPGLEKERAQIIDKMINGEVVDIWGGRQKLSSDKMEKEQKRLEELTDKIMNYKEAIEDVNELDFVGPMPTSATADEATWSNWKKKIAEIQKEKEKSGTTPMFSPDDITKFDSVLKFSKELKKRQDELAASLKANKELLKTATDESKASIEADIEADEKQLELVNALKVALGIVFRQTSGTRDTRLSQLKSDISELTNAYKKFLDLQKYMSKETALKEIDKLFPQLAGWEPTLDNVIAKLQSKLEDVKKQLAKSPKSKTLLDMQRALETEISNLQVDNLKDQLEKKIKQISDEMKRSETARKFYNDILGLTGDQELATNLSLEVYGTIGDEFKDRIGKELYQALHDIDPENIAPDLMALMEGDLTIFDFEDIKKHLDELPPKVKETFEKVLAENEQYDSEWYKSFISTFKKAESYESRIATLNAQRAQKLTEARARKDFTQADEDAINKYYDEKVAGVQLEALKNTYEWTKAFEDLEGVSDRTLKNLIKLIEDFINLNKQNLTPEQLKELTRQLEQIKIQDIQRHSIEGLTGALKKYEAATERRNELEKEGKKDTLEYVKATNDQKRAIKELSDAYAALIAELETYITSVKELMSTFASDDDASYWSSQLDNLTKTLGGVGKFAVGLASIAAGSANPQTIAATVSGLADMVSGIFGGVKAKQIRDANKVIDAQDEKLKALTKSYDKLGDAMAKSFGTDYIYNFNEQLDILLAKQKAYEEQAAAEEGKGKKADKKKAEEYRQSAEEASEEIENMKGKLAEFFAGTDVTSAAKDFASAWIEAYKEFGSTTDAMKEKFQDLVQSMVEQSLAAKIMQGFLQPIFDEIDAMAKDGALDAAEIAMVSKMATSVIPQINDAMTNLMTQLSSAGYNMRQQAGKFTGISRDIASASEESILGLAAGINTQNSYMYAINENVKQILALMNGGTTPAVTQTATAEEGGPKLLSVQELVNSHLPSIDQNISSILTAITRVIRTEGSQHYVAVRM